MSHTLICIALVITMPVAPAAFASTTTIGVYFDGDATDCDATVVPGSPFEIYATVVLGTDAGRAGITGADFRVDGLAGLVLAVTPNPAAFASFGNPTSGGCSIAFPVCVTGTGQRTVVLLYTVTCVSGQPVSPRTVIVRHIASPSGDPPWQPSVLLCDEPAYTRLYVSGGQALINNGNCTVAARPALWGSVKALFRG